MRAASLAGILALAAPRLVGQTNQLEAGRAALAGTSAQSFTAASMTMTGDPPKPQTPLGVQIQRRDFTRNASSMFAAQAELTKPSSEAAAAPEPSSDLSPEEAERAREAAEQAAERARIMNLAKRYRLLVLAGRWSEVAQFLDLEAGEDASAIHHITVNKLVKSDSHLAPREVLALGAAAPTPPSKDVITLLGQLLRQAAGRGYDLDLVARAVDDGLRHFQRDDNQGRRRAARLLVAARLARQAERYLPSLEDARGRRDAEALAMWGAYRLALAKATEGVEASQAAAGAWRLAGEAIAITDDYQVQREALGIRLELTDTVDDELVERWLDRLFDGDNPLGWIALERLEQVTRQASQTLAMDTDRRAQALVRQARVAEACAAAVRDGAAVWRPALEAMSQLIIAEARETRNEERSNKRSFIPAADLAPAMPGAAWFGAVDPGLARRLRTLRIIILARAGRAEEALETVRPLVDRDPQFAADLLDNLLDAWGHWSSPDRAGNARDPYGRQYTSYGGVYYSSSYYNPYQNPPPETIPLTRARQERNLRDLRRLIGEIREMAPGYDGHETLVAAFAEAHSSAEVFRPDDIQAVFGPPGEQPPEVALALAEQMRLSLAGAWRDLRTQRRAGANRSKPQMVAEVIRGYRLALDLAETARRAAPDSWRPVALLGDLAFDQAEFLYGQEADLDEYASSREKAFTAYAEACQRYQDQFRAGRIGRAADPYFKWFAASLGASDLGYLTRLEQPDNTQIDRIATFLDALGDDERREHLALLAELIEERLEDLNPELKPRYVDQAAQLVGDHPAGEKIRRLRTYYEDLTNEVRLTITPDDSSDVGSTPFGVRIALESTRAVSRESGGFHKYLRNQVWDRVTGAQVNYRDDFEREFRTEFGDVFEIHTLVFHEPDDGPISSPRPGWDRHPLGYAVVSVIDPSVDRLPQVQLDMDFSDGPGRVILPIASQEALIDATAAPGSHRVEGLSIEQVLDTRRFEQEGRITLEVIASGAGVIPELERLVDVTALAPFEVVQRHDHGVNIAELSVGEDEAVAKTDRSWMLELAIAGAAAPYEFRFLPSLDEAAEASYKRFSDADIIEAASVVPLTDRPFPWRWVWIGGGAGVLALCGATGGLWLRRRRRGRGQDASARFRLPDHLTPMSAYALLRRVEAAAMRPLSSAERERLRSDLAWIESSYFANGGAPSNGDLERRVRSWCDRAHDPG